MIDNITVINPFYETSLILSLAVILAFVGRYFKQPLVVMFLLAGILAGPSCLKIIHNYENIRLLAHIGITILLFIVGLKLDLHLIKTTGLITLITGGIQIIVTFITSFVLCSFLEFNFISNLYISMALTFSSTIVVIKLLSDKNDIDSLYGKFIVGILILQDIVALWILIFLPTIKINIEYSQLIYDLLWSFFKGLCIIFILFISVSYILTSLLKHLAQSNELLLLFAIAWAVLWSSVFSYLGFSREIGAFLAGVSLAYTDYKDMITYKLSTLRDFLLLFFFIDLGAKLNIFVISLSSLYIILLLSIVVILTKVLAIMSTLGFLGYKKRIGFFTGISLTQISEFSLIVISLGVELGHVSKYVLDIITIVAMITILISTYLQLFLQNIYDWFSGYLTIFERISKIKHNSIDKHSKELVDVVIFGLGRYGVNIVKHLLSRNKKIIGIDFNPQNLDIGKSLGIKVLYGDMSDSELYDVLSTLSTQWIVSTIRNIEQNIRFIKIIKSKNINAKIAMAATTTDEVKIYEQIGADVVFKLFEDAAEQAADSLTHAVDIMPMNTRWGLSFKEIRIKSGSIFAGKKLKEIPLRAFTKTSIIAISRATKIYYEPDSDFVIYPNDRLIIVGNSRELIKAENLLNQQYIMEKDAEPTKEFDIAELDVSQYKNICGKSLKEVQFRQKYGVTVVGIVRDEQNIVLPDPNEIILLKDKLVVIGIKDLVDKLKS